MATLALAEPKKATTCPRCRGGHEVYLYWRTSSSSTSNAHAASSTTAGNRSRSMTKRANCDRAQRDLCAAPRPRQSLRPGIISYVFHCTDSGEAVTAQLLIDGHHRAARCVRDRLPFFAYLLTEEESQAILVRSPAKPGRSLLDVPRENTNEPDVDLHPATTEAYEQNMPRRCRSRCVPAKS